MCYDIAFTECLECSSSCGNVSNIFLLIVYEYLNLIFKLICHNIIIPLGKSYLMQLQCFIIIFVPYIFAQY